ncbi:DUF6443 domain-containing protein [Aquimarina aggregata]|uniref:DUF6443 domain-containing protein n=1 Tax=Aquimarina aggregata TaxID=1642818 RepID=UPI002493A7C0|nr:DUF6443 domain-containing protein [Aquimarina aggregata]
MKNKIQNYIVLIIIMMSTASAFSQFGGGEDGGGGDNCNIYSYRDADRDGYGVFSQKICDTDVPDGYSTRYGDRDDNNALITDLPPKYFYFDKDKDSYGNPNNKVYASRRPNGYVTNNSDYDDNNKLITNIAPRNFYRDYDKDGFGNPSNKVYRSAKPSGYVTDARDCNDSDKTVNPNTVWYLDNDNDNYARSTKKQCTSPGSKYKRSVTGSGDCNDSDATLNPLTVWYYDNDGDGFGNEGDLSTVRQQCGQPSSKYVRKKGDINDNNEYITNITPKNFYRDADKDTYGNPNIKYYRSFAPSDGHTYVTNGSDYDDSTGHITNIAPKNFYRDADKDTYGNPSIKYYRSKAPSDGYIYVTNGSDRDDGNKWITNIAPKNFYRDADKDTYGNPSIKYYRSAAPSDGYVYVTNGSDCNDGDKTLNPNTVWYLDNDNDNYARSTKKQCTSPGLKYKRSVAGSGDCNDSDATLNPLTVWYYDNDGDGFGNEGDLSTVRQQCGQPSSKYVRKKGDINDNNEYITNVPPKNFYRDADKDTYGNPSIKFYRSFPPADTHSYVTNGSDHDDSNEFITNIAPKNFYRDGDGDTFGNPDIKFYRSAAPSDTYSYVTNGSDYDDSNEFITNIAPKNFYRDGDKDTFGNPNIKFYRSAAPSDAYSYVTNGNDCNDADASLTPNTVWYKDGDGDTFGDKNSTKKQCTKPTGYVRNDDDYNDSTENIINIAPQTFYLDTDGDGFGDPNQSVFYSVQPTGYVTNANDNCPDVFGENNGCADTPYAGITISNENYVFTRAYQEEMDAATAINFNKDVIESITYFDGLGRPKQQVGIKASPQAKDIVTHITYDQYGRQAQQYLPFERPTGTTTPLGSYASVNVVTDINSYYNNVYGADFTVAPDHQNFNAYSESIFEPSPLNRVQEQGAPGSAWKANKDVDTDHTIKFDWDTNTLEEVIKFRVQFTGSDTESPTLVQQDFYPVGELQVTITKDENWTAADGNNHTTREYTDKAGRVVLKRTYNTTPNTSGGSSAAGGGEAHDTYYVYDDFGNLTYVIPPKVTTADGVSTTEMNELCYQYKYDYRNRLIEKKIPGKGWEYIVYNTLDQPILTQDALLKQESQWLFTKYDALGRVAYTGKMTDTRTRSVIQDAATAYSDDVWVDKTTTGIRYNDGGYPKVTTGETLTINYYDDYEFLGTTPIQELANPGTVSGEAITNRTRSLPTGSKVKVLGEDKWITTVTYYDNKARPIYVASNNEYLNTTDSIESELDFVGKVLKTKTTHTKGSNTAIVTVDTFTYDHMGRAKKQTQQINNQDTEVIAENTYDALGQLISKKVGGSVTSSGVEGSSLQTIDYTYNVRGWMTGINDVENLGNDLFSFLISYNAPKVTGIGVNPLFNGNISETQWKTANDNKKRAYGYLYDNLNRVKITRYTDNMSSYTGQYNTAYSYDKMGNILTLARNTTDGSDAYTQIDRLTYRYENASNRLLAVTDNTSYDKGFNDRNKTGDDYDYDTNGNMIKDQNKGITSITYNHLNLPETVSISNSEGTGTISYIYDATGAKLKKTAPSGSSLITTEYAGNYVYKNNQLQYMSTPEGYATPEGSSYRYVYQYKDHLDNVRLSYTKNDSGSIEIVEENNYYPFGLQHKGYNNTVSSLGNSTAQLLSFGGKEEQNELGLGWIDITARNYDPALGRWMNLDPLAEQMRRHSPYNYGFDNPIYFIDPDGMAPSDRWQKGSDGTLTWVNNDGGDTTDYVDTVDNDGNVTSTEEIAVENVEQDCSTCEVDIKSKSPGTRHTFKAGGDPRIQEADLGDAVSEVVEAVGGEIDVNPMVMAGVMLVINPKKLAKQLKKAKHIKKQASEIKNTLNNGKNSVTVKTGNGQIRYDLEGKAHGVIDTPHTQSYKNNVVNGEVKSVTRTSKHAEPMTQQDIRTVRKVLKKRKNGK